MSPPEPGVYTVRMVYKYGQQETIWKYASWDGESWHLPPAYTLIEWMPDPATDRPRKD